MEETIENQMKTAIKSLGYRVIWGFVRKGGLALGILWIYWDYAGTISVLTKGSYIRNF